MRWLVSFDVGNPRRRVRVARLLEAHGHRVQESVFLLQLRPSQWQALRMRMTATVDAQDDHWRAWPLCDRDTLDALNIGLPAPAMDGPTVVV